jgi:hypothetical protein
MIYYKATRVSGESFHADPRGKHTLYEVGATLVIPEERRQAKCCSPGVLHASDVPAETLIGGSWPCRLFEVMGESVVQEGHKHGFFELTVEREIEAWKALGPNGREILALIDWLKSNGAKPWYKAIAGAARSAARSAAWDAAWDAARSAAWSAAWSAASYAASYAAWDAASDAASDAAWDAARSAAWDAAWSAASYAASYAAWDAARRAASDAALGIHSRDLITAAQFEALYSPAIAALLPAESLGPWESLSRGEAQ